MVDTASKPRKDRHSTAAPAMTSATLKPSWWNGASNDTGALWSLRLRTDSATKTTMNTSCATTSIQLTRVIDSMPIRLRKVTRAIEPSTHTQAGTAGKYSDM
ncbi:hypothetical protein D3C73_1360600 [compost metagenome]